MSIFVLWALFNIKDLEQGISVILSFLGRYDYFCWDGPNPLKKGWKSFKKAFVNEASLLAYDTAWNKLTVHMFRRNL